MAETSKMNLADHAREISFAVFRVAKLIEQPKLKSALESAAVELVSESGNVPYVSYVPGGESLPYLPYVERLVNLVRLAELIEEINPVNARVLVRELSALKSAIAESVSATYAAREKSEDIDLEVMFKKENTIIPSEAVIPSSAPPLASLAPGGRNPDDVTENREILRSTQDDKFKLPRTIKIPGVNQVSPQQLQTAPVTETNFDNAVARQSAIIEFIKQLPNGCRMKDLMAKFPGVSERTLRNDLQILAAEDKIERFGAVQGPFSYFRVKVIPSPALAERGTPGVLRPAQDDEAVTKNEIISL